MEEIQMIKLEQLRESYQKIRNEKLATGITIRTMTGDFDIKNPQIVNAVLDFLIKEVTEQIKAKTND